MSVSRKLEKALGKEVREQIIKENINAFPEMKETLFLGNSGVRKFWFEKISHLNKTFLKEWLKQKGLEPNKQVERELDGLGEALAHKVLNEQEMENCEKVMKMILKNPSVDHVGYTDVDNGKWHYTDLAQRVRDLKVTNKLIEELEEIHFKIISKHFEAVSGKNVEEELRKLRARKSYYKRRVLYRLSRKEGEEMPYYR